MARLDEARFEAWALHKDPAELGRMVKEYIAESNHGGWDGFDRRDLTGIRKMLVDMQIYFDNCEPGHFQKTSNINPL